jgi:hypothetical protein
MKSRARGTCVVWGVLLVLVFVSGSRCFAGDDLAMKWFFQLGEAIESNNWRDSNSTLAGHFRMMLLNLGEFDRAYSVFQLEDWKEREDGLLRYAIYYFYKDHTPKKEHLEILFRALCDHEESGELYLEYSNLLDRVADINAHDLTKKIINKAISIKNIGDPRNELDDPFIKAYWATILYEHGILAGMEKVAADMEKKMIKLWSAFPDSDRLEGKELFDARRVRLIICEDYIEAYLRLGELNKAQIYLDRYKATLLKDPSHLVNYYGLETFIQLCQKIGQPDQGRRLVEDVFDMMLPDQGDVPEGGLDFFSYWAKPFPPPCFYEVVDYEYLKKKWHLAMKRDNGEVAAAMSRILFEGAVHHKKYAYAVEILETYERRWKGGLKDLDWYYYYVFGNRMWHDPLFDYETFSHTFDNPYYHMDLDYEYVWRMLREGDRNKAKKYLDRALGLMIAYKDRESFQYKSIYYGALLDMCWRMDDSEGILKIIKHFRVDYGKGHPLTKPFDLLMYPPLIDVYLCKGEIDRALKFIEELDDLEVKCIGYVFAAKKFIDMGEIERGKSMMKKVFTMIEERKIQELMPIVDDFYRIFFVRPGLDSWVDRPADIVIYPDHGWGFRSDSQFEN